MTKPRISLHREICGLLGRFPDRAARLRRWNEWFSREGIDAVMESYPATAAELPERFSEMFHFDRRFYLVGKKLEKAVLPLLDELDEAARTKRRVNVVINKGGVLHGALIDNADEPENGKLPVSFQRNYKNPPPAS